MCKSAQKRIVLEKPSDLNVFFNFRLQGEEQAAIEDIRRTLMR